VIGGAKAVARASRFKLSESRQQSSACTTNGRSHDAVIRVYDEAGNVIETHEHAAISKSGNARFKPVQTFY
jgi:hypothetical protein